MNKSRYLGLAILFTLAFVLVIPAEAADKMTFEDYQIQLQKYQDRETKANEAIATEKEAIAELRSRIAELEADIAVIWDEIYRLLRTTEDELLAYLEKIAAQEAMVDELARLAPERLLDRASELDVRDADVDLLLADRLALLSEPRNRLNRLKSRISALRASLPKPKHDIYHVIRGDYLWKISGKSQIYDDPWKWMRIYSANREEIKDPDLIFPEQIFRIPRQIGRDEHLVSKGEFLRKIAGYAEVYGDPFQWTKIYQANKSLIQDPNLIYPELILTIPRH